MEHPAYRDNLEQILEFTDGRHLLSIRDVMQFTGVKHYNTIHKIVPFVKS